MYVRPGLSIQHLEEKLAGVLTVVRTSSDVSPDCLKFAFPSLCMFAFPPCDKTVHAHKPQMGELLFIFKVLPVVIGSSNARGR